MSKAAALKALAQLSCSCMSTGMSSATHFLGVSGHVLHAPGMQEAVSALWFVAELPASEELWPRRMALSLRRNQNNRNFAEPLPCVVTELPACEELWPRLTALDLSRNSLGGAVPEAALSLLRQCVSLNLSFQVRRIRYVITGIHYQLLMRLLHHP